MVDIPLIQDLIDGATAWPALGGAQVDHTDWRAFWADCAAAGVLRMGVPEAYGGRPATASDILEVMTEIGRICLDTGLPMALNSQLWTVQTPLMAFGSEAQKAAYLPRLISGEMVAGFAMTEAEAGSNALALKTRAERRGDGYVLTGAKTYVGLATEFDLALVFASTAPERKSWGLSCFLVEAGDLGLTRGPAQPKMGLNSTPMGEVRFDECYVAEGRRLGPEGAGGRIFQATMDWERSFLFATQVGAMVRQLEASIDFAKGREVFGAPISDYQSVSNRLADMAVTLETCKLMQQKAALLYDEGRLTAQFAAMTKLHISEAYLASSLSALRIHGGAGFLEGSKTSEDLRDAVGGVLYSGTSDIQRNIIARTLTTRS